MDVPDDDRSFSAATFSTVDEVYALAKREQQLCLPAEELVAHLGSYLQAHLRGARCADTIKTTTKLVLEYNTRVHDLSPETRNLPLLSPEDTQPTSTGEPVSVYIYWEKPVFRDLMARYKQLRFGDPGELAADPQPTVRGGMAPYSDERCEAATSGSLSQQFSPDGR